MFFFVIQIFWVFFQTRRQNFAAGGSQNYKGGKHFLNTILDVCSNWGARYKMATYILNGVGTTSPPLAMALFYCTNTGLFECAIWVSLK